MKKNVFRLIGIIVLLFLVWRIVILLIGTPGGRSSGSGRPPVAVEIDSIRTEPIREIREFTGTVFPEYQYIIAPKVAGRILEIRKRIGDWVAAGEVIARIDDAEYQQAVLEADASLRIAKATLAETRSQSALAKQELDRVRSLQEKGIASPSELDAALTNFDAQESRLKLAQAQVEQREAALQSSRIRLGYTVLSASEPGFVGERYVDEGSLLSPNTAVVKVIGIDDVIVRTTIIERDYGRIRVSQEATVEVDAFPGHPFTGRVARIAPMLQEASRMADMEIEVKNDSLLLKPGMFTRVYVVLSRKDTAVVVPSKAVVNHGGRKGLFVIDSTGTHVRFYEVQTGIIADERTEIVSPLPLGLVVTLGQHLLEDGSPVILPSEAGEENGT